MCLCLGVAHTVLPQDAVTLLGSRQDPEPPGHLPKALQTPTPTPGIQYPQHSSHTQPQPLQEASLAWSRRYSYRQAVSGRWDPEGFLQEGATKLSWEGWLPAYRPPTKSSPAVSPSPHCKSQGAAGGGPDKETRYS